MHALPVVFEKTHKQRYIIYFFEQVYVLFIKLYNIELWKFLNMRIMILKSIGDHLFIFQKYFGVVVVNNSVEQRKRALRFYFQIFNERKSASAHIVYQYPML